MADETKLGETQTDLVPEPEPEVKPEPDEIPHPLEPGGVRFEEVYRRGKEAERRAEELEIRLRNLETQVAKPKEETRRRFTATEVQTMIDEGRLTLAQGMDYLARASAQDEGERIVKDYEERGRKASAESRASAEIGKYVELIPALADRSSAEMKKVARAYNELVEVDGLPHGLGTERLALLSVYGPLEAISKRKELSDKQRQGEDTFLESSGGGGKQEETKGPKLTQRELDYCKRIGMDPKEYAKWKVERPAKK